LYRTTSFATIYPANITTLDCLARYHVSSKIVEHTAHNSFHIRNLFRIYLEICLFLPVLQVTVKRFFRQNFSPCFAHLAAVMPLTNVWLGHDLPPPNRTKSPSFRKLPHPMPWPRSMGTRTHSVLE
jgi:hypothetical protein